MVPYVAFRRRYSNEELSLRSSNRRAGLFLILVILLIESSVQLSLQPGIFRLDGHQLLVGIPLTFVLSFAGTVLPTMVFVCCILTPRYLRITGSVPSAVILGGSPMRCCTSSTDGPTSSRRSPPPPRPAGRQVRHALS